MGEDLYLPIESPFFSSSSSSSSSKRSTFEHSRNTASQDGTMINELPNSNGSAAAINSSNKGFQLLKKHGWREGTGLGISEQGRLEPVETHLKNNKRGLGADKVKKKMTSRPLDAVGSNGKNEKEKLSSKKTKMASKRIKKMQELEMRLQEKEFERSFFREFWPDNV